jgi:hypothetical protein
MSKLSKSARVLMIALMIAGSSFLSACGGDRKEGNQSPTCTGAGCETINEGIDTFFQNEEPCSNIVC